MRQLDELQIIGILYRATSSGTRLRTGLSVDDLGSQVLELHASAQALSLAKAAAHLIEDIVKLEPVSVTSAHDAQRRREASVALAKTFARQFLDLNDRSTTDNDWDNPDLNRCIRELVLNAQFHSKRLEDQLRRLVPNDLWVDAGGREDAIGSGLTALVGGPTSGADALERTRTADMARAIAQELTELGFHVIHHVEHAEGDDCHFECPSQRSVDLFVAVLIRPSVRMGHQIGGVADTLGITLALVDPSVRELSCLFKSPELGLIRTERYSNRSDVRGLVRAFVEENIRVLRLRSQMALKFQAWHFDSFWELHERVNERMSSNVRSDEPSLVSKPVVLRLISSIEAYSGASLALIDAVRSIVGLAPLAGVHSNVYEALFSRDQLWELDQLILHDEIPATERGALLQCAARSCVSSDRSTGRRLKTYTGPGDWIGEYVQLQAMRGAK